MIASCEKREEYREIKHYWLQRLFEVAKPLVIENSNIRYDKLDRMFHFAVGFIGNRAGAVKYLWNEGHIIEKDLDIVSANNGYQKDCPNVKWKHEGIRIGTGKTEWGAEPGKQYFILSIGEIIK